MEEKIRKKKKKCPVFCIHYGVCEKRIRKMRKEINNCEFARSKNGGK
jgi:hypothetical protein